MKNSHRRIPAAQTAGPMYGVLIYDNNQTQSGVQAANERDSSAINSPNKILLKTNPSLRA